MKRSLSRMAAVLLLWVPALLLSCGGKAESLPETGNGRLNVFVSIVPQKYFTEQIGGDRVHVSVMVPPGSNPATYEPTPRQMVALGQADLFFSIGVAFERTFLGRVQSSLPAVQLVRTDAGIEKRHLDEDSNDGHGHESGEPDPHIWMDPVLAQTLAALMRDSMIAADPAGEQVYRQGCDRLLAMLSDLNGEITDELAPYAGNTLFVYHPAFGYFADRYGLRQVAIETGGREPTAGQLEEIISHAGQEGVRVIFVQPEFPRKSAEAVADAIGGVVVPAAPLREDYPDSLRELARAVAEGMHKP